MNNGIINDNLSIYREFRPKKDTMEFTAYFTINLRDREIRQRLDWTLPAEHIETVTQYLVDYVNSPEWASLKESYEPREVGHDHDWQLMTTKIEWDNHLQVNTEKCTICDQWQYVKMEL